MVYAVGVMVCACGMSEVWDPNVMVWGVSVRCVR